VTDGFTIPGILPKVSESFNYESFRQKSSSIMETEKEKKGEGMMWRSGSFGMELYGSLL
jgi:hypothetical protein